jgi:hypothetical protein
LPEALSFAVAQAVVWDYSVAAVVAVVFDYYLQDLQSWAVVQAVLWEYSVVWQYLTAVAVDYYLMALQSLAFVQAVH